MTLEWLIGVLVFGIAVLTFVSISSRRNVQLDTVYYKQKWEEIQALLNDEDNLSLSIIEADKLLDKALKESRFKGKTMGERMVSAKNVFTKRNHVWMAHKIRNKLVHETDATVNTKQTKAALTAYYRALRDLEAL